MKKVIIPGFFCAIFLSAITSCDKTVKTPASTVATSAKTTSPTPATINSESPDESNKGCGDRSGSGGY